MKRICAWMLFTFAAVNIIVAAIIYTEGDFHFVRDVTKFILISLALWGWSRWK